MRYDSLGLLSSSSIFAVASLALLSWCVKESFSILLASRQSSLVVSFLVEKSTIDYYLGGPFQFQRGYPLSYARIGVLTNGDNF